MNVQELNLLLNDSSAPFNAEQEALSEVVIQYPYFQAARALHLKALKNLDSFHYNQALKVTAAHTADREILFQYITSSDFKSTQAEQDSLEQPTTEITEPAAQKQTTEVVRTKTLNFGRDDRHSFAIWLQLSDQGALKSMPTKPKEVEELKQNNENKLKPVATREKKQALIDQFLKTNPRITPTGDIDLPPTTEINSSFDPKALMTETLAQVYLEQQKYAEAIQAYKILSLKYPEKNSFFAGQIQAIKKIQKSKS
jgi:hypothetical protein